MDGKMNEEKMLREIGRIVAGAYYDHQSVRTASMNRIRDVIRARVEGIDKSKPEAKKEKKSFDKKYADENLPKFLDELLAKQKLTNEEHEYLIRFLELAQNALKLENQYKTFMLQYVETEPIYTKFLKHIKGIGPVIACQLIRNFGYCEKFRHVSSLWKLCGLHVVDGKAPKRQKKQKTDYSPRLRAFVWNIGQSFLRAKTPCYYRLYLSFKEQEAAKEFPEGELAKIYGKPYTEKDTKLRPLHVHNRAKRKMEKIFLQHYWVCARELAGLPTDNPWAEKIGHKKFITWKDALKENLEAQQKGTVIEP